MYFGTKNYLKSNHYQPLPHSKHTLNHEFPGVTVRGKPDLITMQQQHTGKEPIQVNSVHEKQNN
jgi:hypothetical protein